MAEGIVYVLTNEAMPGLVKIGYTKRNIDNRLNELYSTGVPLPFKCEYACFTHDIEQLERALHAAFEPQRVNPNREFFAIEPDRVIPILRYCNGKEEPQEVTENIQSELNAAVSPQEQEAEREYRKRRAVFDFDIMGIPRGADIVFTNNGIRETATIAGPRQVEYKGERLYLTKLTRRLRDVSFGDPLPYWTYQGRVLKDIYNEVYPFNLPPDEM